MTGIILILFQYGILFMSYLTLVHMTRDVGRWLAVHPNTTDSKVAEYVGKDLPTSVMVPTSIDGPALHCTAGGTPTVWTCNSGPTLATPANGGLLLDFSPTCVNYNSTTKRCMKNATDLSRGSGEKQRLTITYDAASRMFLPATIKFAGLNVTMPGRYQTYSYFVMVEPD